VYLRVAIAALIVPTARQGSRLAPEPMQSSYVVVYGVKTVTPSLTGEEAKKRGLRYADMPKVHVTRLFSLDPSNGKTTLVFSDEALPVMVLNRQGGMETALYDIIATRPSKRKAIALMGTRPGPGDRSRPTPSLYELSLDGSNVVRRIADVESMITFAVSGDGEQIAYFLYNPKRLVIRSTDSGGVRREISLEGNEFADLPHLRWSPDGHLLLVARWPGPEYKTQYELVHLPEGRVERTQMSDERYSGFPKDEIYSFFPKSERLLGVHLLYDGSSASPLRRFFSMAPTRRDTLDLSLPPCRGSWHAEVSPDERLIAYPCNKDQDIEIAGLARGEGRQSDTNVAVGRAEVLQILSATLL
jgi:hypothetical protein